MNRTVNHEDRKRHHNLTSLYFRILDGIKYGWYDPISEEARLKLEETEQIARPFFDIYGSEMTQHIKKFDEDIAPRLSKLRELLGVTSEDLEGIEI